MSHFHFSKYLDSPKVLSANELFDYYSNLKVIHSDMTSHFSQPISPEARKKGPTGEERGRANFDVWKLSPFPHPSPDSFEKARLSPALFTGAGKGRGRHITGHDLKCKNNCCFLRFPHCITQIRKQEKQ